MLIAELERANPARRRHRRQRTHPAGTAAHHPRLEAQPVPRIGDAARLFFMPFEPFLIDDPADHKRARPHRAGLARADLGVDRPRSDAGRSQGADRGHQSRAARRRSDQGRAIDPRAARARHPAHEGDARHGRHDEKARRRLGVQVGTPRATRRRRDAFCASSKSATGSPIWRGGCRTTLRAFEREQIDRSRCISIRCAAIAGGDAARKADLYHYGLAAGDEPACGAVAIDPPRDPRRRERRCRAHRRNALCGGGHDRARRNRMHGRANCAPTFKRGQPVTSMLKAIHDAARGLRTEMDLSVEFGLEPPAGGDPQRHFEPAEESEIEATPGRVRRLLRPRAGQGDRARFDWSTPST